jgi:RNA polymerase sigma-70 factor (ECF subfamily)
VGKGATLEELEAAYREHLPQFVRAAGAIAGGEAAGAEAVQEAFAHAVRERRTFRGDAPLDAWIWRIVVNTALSARRRRPADEPLDAEALAAPSRGGLADVAVRQWVAALPERQRLAIFLRYFAELDYRGIAEALGVEIGTVSATLSAAHTALRRALQEEEVAP